MLFVNSLGTDLSVWQAQAEALGAGHRVLRYDQRGHGRSPVPPGPYSIGQLGLDALGVVNRLGVNRFSLAGVSLGAAVAMWVAGEAPERIERLMLCCTSSSFGPPDPWHERAARVRAEGMESVAEQVIDRWFTPSFKDREPRTVAHFELGLLATNPGGYAACCEAIAELDLHDRLGAIRAPTAVVAAPHDLATPVEQLEEVAAGIKGAQLTVLPDGAHLANVERADEVSGILLEHLTKEAA